MELFMAQINERQTAMENSDDILIPVICSVLMECYSEEFHKPRYAAAAKAIHSFSNRGHLAFILRIGL